MQQICQRPQRRSTGIPLASDLPGISPGGRDQRFTAIGQWDVVVAPDGRTAVSASNDCTLRVWDLASEMLRYVLKGHESWVCSADISHDGGLVAAGALDGSVRCWKLGAMLEICGSAWDGAYLPG